MLIEGLVIGAALSIAAKKQSFLQEYSDESGHQIEYILDSDFEENIYFLDSHEKSIRSFLTKELDQMEVSSKVKINSLNLIKNLSTLFLENFNVDDFYESSYGTVIFDFNKNTSNFNIEVGQNSLGYFCEIDGIIVKLIEDVKLDDDFKNNLGSVNIDFLDYYEKIKC